MAAVTEHPERMNDAAPDGYTVIDTGHLKSLSRGNKKFISALVSIFYTPQHVELIEIENAISAKNYDVIKSIAHKMKTSGGFIGIKNLVPDLNKIETLAIHKGDIDEIGNLFNSVKNICRQANNELKKALQDPAISS